ncbi:MAG: DUF983 domain-containing protein [bacterium]
MPTSKNVASRTTESALDMPSMGRALLLASRALRLRCPHCGTGRVLSGFNTVHERCSACGFHFCRSDDEYFSGAMFFGMMIGETLAILGIGAAIWATYPDVPWSFLQYAIPLVLLGVMVLLFPVSRVVWLAIDVLLRPVEPSELVPSAGGLRPQLAAARP